MRWKLYSNSHLGGTFAEFEKRHNGLLLHKAKDAGSIVVCEIVEQSWRKHGEKQTMLAEECEIQTALIEKGIDVVESGSRRVYLQLMNLAPSHI